MVALTADEAIDAQTWNLVHLSHSVAACWRPVDTSRYLGASFIKVCTECDMQ